jgi:DNA helicase-2/ATP-dependent DNA helicase PcrA
MLAQLNAPQRAAVATLRGPLLVLAGAGTGKTRVVTYRIANLIAHGVAAERILAVTFTKKAAREMKDRIGALMPKPKGAKKQPAAGPIVATFHAYCVKILRRHIRRLGYPEQFSIYDRGDQESLARQVLREIKVDDAALKPGELLWMISTWKNRCIRPRDAVGDASTDKEHLGAVAYRRYQRALKNAGVVDFDDLLLLTEELFAGHEAARRDEAARLDHLLIDEYQDTNGSQYRIVKALAGGHRNLCVVGDDDQSIYGWRGAEVEHILHFQRDWPEAKIVRLEDNYRSQAEIIEVANRLIRFNATRHDKLLRPSRGGGQKPHIWQAETEEKEAEMVVADIRKRVSAGASPGEFAILFRTNEQPRQFEQQLRKAKLPYLLVGGMSFFDRREVRDVLAYLKVLEYPDDEVALRRIINTPARGIGQGTVEQLVKRAVEAGTPLWRVLCDAKQVTATAGPKASDAVQRFVAMLAPFQAEVHHGGIHQASSRSRETSGSDAQRTAPARTLTSSATTLADVARRLVEKVQYKQELHRLYDSEEDRTSRWGSVEEVVNALAEFEQQTKKPTLKDFLDEIMLAGRDMETEKEEKFGGKIVLMTMHAAKGLEFPHVYMVGMEDGLLPHHRSLAVDGPAIEEERRLCYVGVTRAMERLTLSLALTRMKWGKPRETIPSRFLFEITGQADQAHDAVKPPRARPGKVGRISNPST